MGYFFKITSISVSAAPKSILKKTDNKDIKSFDDLEKMMRDGLKRLNDKGNKTDSDKQDKK